MRKRIGFAVSCASLLACGGACAPRPSATAATRATTATTAPTGPCTAWLLHEKPLHAAPQAPHVVVGSIVATESPDGVSAVVRGPDGAVWTKQPRTSEKAALDFMIHGVCALGGEVYWLDGKPESGMPIHMAVGRYTRHDEAADLATMCAPFASLKDPRTGAVLPNAGQFDDLQRGRIRAQIASESITSPKWRIWIHDYGRALFEGDRATCRARIAELRAAAPSCEAEWLTRPCPAQR